MVSLETGVEGHENVVTLGWYVAKNYYMPSDL